MPLKDLIDAILEGKSIELRTGEGTHGWVELERPKSFTLVQLEEFVGYQGIRVKL